MENEPRKKDELIPGKDVAMMSMQIGFSIALATTFFILLGRWLDGRYGTSPAFILIGGALGLAVSLYMVWKIVKALINPKGSKKQ